MVQSYAVCFGTLFASWILALIADRSDSKKPVWLIIIILSLISGLRAHTVGLDTQMYAINFELLGDGLFNQVYAIEESFKYICYYLMKIKKDPVFVFTVLSFITNGLIILRLWDFRKIASFPTMVSCYYMAFFLLSLNVSRQFVAIAIVFYATKYLTEKRYISYLIGILVAMLFHQSACFSLVLFVIEFFGWQSYSVSRKVTFLGMLLLSPIAMYFVFTRVLRYERYFVDTNVDIGIMIVFKILFLLATLMFVFLFKGNGNELKRKMEENPGIKFEVILVVLSYFLGLIFAFLSYFAEMLNRVSWYFYIFESVYLGMLVKTRRDIKILYIVYIAVIIGWGFMTTILNNSQGTMPYRFFWQ